jgi:hypothetical protein
MGDMTNAYKVLVGNPEGRRFLRGSRCRWENNIKVDPGEILFEFVEWIHLAQYKDSWRAFVTTVI